MFRRITATLSLLSLVLVSIVPLTTTAAARTQATGQARKQKKQAPEFDSTSSSGETVRALIQTKGTPSAAHDAALANARGRKQSSNSELNLIVADVPLNSIAALAARDDIEYVSPDRPVKADVNMIGRASCREKLNKPDNTESVIKIN